MLYVFSGLPGVGKSTVARALASRRGALWLRIDSIEAGISASALDVGDLMDAGYRAACAVAADNLALGHAVVADSVNPVALTRDAWADVARAGRHALREIELVCSDPVQHRARVAARSGGPDWDAVLRRRFDPWPRPVLRLDTARLDVAQAVDAILAAG